MINVLFMCHSKADRDIFVFIGLYLLGTVTPEECPSGKVITWTGAASAGECTVCPAGYICPANSNPELCWPGYYCPYNDTEHPCPKATYLDTEGGMNLTDCKPCPAGYFCHQEGMADYRISPCPPGYYCYQSASSPIPCPAGTFRYRCLINIFFVTLYW